MTSHLAGKLGSVHGQRHKVGFEFLGWRGIRVGDLKATWISETFGRADWEISDLAKGPVKIYDPSMERPTEPKRLEKLWDEYADNVGVSLAREIARPALTGLTTG